MLNIMHLQLLTDIPFKLYLVYHDKLGFSLPSGWDEVQDF